MDLDRMRGYIMNLLKNIRQIVRGLSEANEQITATEVRVDAIQAKLDKAIASAKELNDLLGADDTPVEEGESLEAETAAKAGLKADIDRLNTLGNPDTGAAPKVD